MVITNRAESDGYVIYDVYVYMCICIYVYVMYIRIKSIRFIILRERFHSSASSISFAKRKGINIDSILQIF